MILSASDFNFGFFYGALMVTLIVAIVWAVRTEMRR